MEIGEFWELGKLLRSRIVVGNVSCHIGVMCHIGVTPHWSVGASLECRFLMEIS